jgi:hypothetical protein
MRRSFMRIVIDRIEDGIAVCEELSEGHRNRASFELRASELPRGSREGDVLDYENSKLTPNPEAGRERIKRIRKLMDEVFD